MDKLDWFTSTGGSAKQTWTMMGKGAAFMITVTMVRADRRPQ